MSHINAKYQLIYQNVGFLNQEIVLSVLMLY